MGGRCDVRHRVSRQQRGSALHPKPPALIATQLIGRERVVGEHLVALAGDIGARPPGSPANRRATAYAIAELERLGWRVRTQPFTTRWWEPGDGLIGLPSGVHLPVMPNPFTRTGTVRGRMVTCSSVADIDAEGDLSGAVVVLEDSLSEPVAPKGYPFYNPPEHQQLVAAIERARPIAVIAVSSRAASLPTFNDADLDLMSTTVPPSTRAFLAEGDVVTVTLRGATHEGEGVNVSAVPCGFTGGRRLVICAHIDSAPTTPGALDNAGGVAVVLALAASPVVSAAPVELVLFNGEDHFDACGEMAWLEATDLDEIAAAINIDGAGMRGRRVEASWMAFDEAAGRTVAGHVARHPRMTTGLPWVESDHAIFVMRGIPAVAITTADPRDVFEDFVHTAADVPNVVDVGMLVDVVDFVEGLAPDLARALA